MFITFQPVDGETRTWDFDPGKVRAVRAELIEKRYGKNYTIWRADVQSGSAKARRVLLWHLLSLGHPVGLLKFEDTPDFLMEELKVEHSVVELLEIQERIHKASLSDEDREQALAGIAIDITEAMSREGLNAEDEDEPESPKGEHSN